MRETWRKIATGAQASGLGTDFLAQGAPEEALFKLRATGLRIPGELLDSLALHDGQTDPESALPGLGELLACEQIPVWHARLSTADANFVRMGRPDVLGPVKREVASPDRIPFIVGEGLAAWFLDFDPAPGGAAGQVVCFDVAMQRLVVCAPSLAVFWERYAQDLESGAFDDERFQCCWPPVFRIPYLDAATLDTNRLLELGAMGEWGEAERLLDEAAPHVPMATQLRIRAQAAFQSREEFDVALGYLEQLREAGDETADDVLLRLDILETDGAMDEAMVELDRAVALHATAALLERRARHWKACASQAPMDDPVEALEWLASPPGQQSMMTALGRAAVDFERALALQDNPEWRLDHADCLLEAMRWDDAEAAFLQLLERLEAGQEDDEGAIRRERAADEAAESLNALAGLLESLGNEEQLQQIVAMRDAFGRVQTQEAADKAAWAAQPGSLVARAQLTARNIVALHEDIPEEYAAFDAGTLDAEARRFYDETQRDLQALGFIFLGDIESLRFRKTQHREVLLRTLVSADRGTLAFIWRLVGPAQVYATVELESAVADRVLVTNNSGSSNPIAQPGQIEITSLPLGSRAAAVVSAHALRTRGLQPNPIHTLDDVLRLQERQRRIKREAARARGWVSDAELRGLLGASYDELAAEVRVQLGALLG